MNRSFLSNCLVTNRMPAGHTPVFKLSWRWFCNFRPFPPLLFFFSPLSFHFPSISSHPSSLFPSPLPSRSFFSLLFLSYSLHSLTHLLLPSCLLPSLPFRFISFSFPFLPSPFLPYPFPLSRPLIVCNLKFAIYGHPAGFAASHSAMLTVSSWLFRLLIIFVIVIVLQMKHIERVLGICLIHATGTTPGLLGSLKDKVLLRFLLMNLDLYLQIHSINTPDTEFTFISVPGNV